MILRRAVFYKVGITNPKRMYLQGLPRLSSFRDDLTACVRDLHQQAN